MEIHLTMNTELQRFRRRDQLIVHNHRTEQLLSLSKWETQDQAMI